jgi:peptidyl-prolyl cis-trans isomerase B (cyclophilin B)
VPTSKDRQRKLARAKLDRQLARRAAKARRRRQLQAGIGAAVALLLIVLGSVWLAGGFDADTKPAAETAAGPCTWSAQSTTGNANLKDVGTPPTTDIAQAGTRPLIITTNQGEPITVTLDLAKAPCGAANFAHLASKQFFDNTKCHEITAEGAVRCGDPSGTGLGGPSYTYADENTPQAPAPDPSAPATPAAPLYPKGTFAAVGTTPGNNGSQFLLFFKDYSPPAESPLKYSVLGTVTGGQATLDKIGAIGTVDNGSGVMTKPKTDVVVQSLTVSDIAGAPAPPSGAPAPAPSS